MILANIIVLVVVKPSVTNEKWKIRYSSMGTSERINVYIKVQLQAEEVESLNTYEGVNCVRSKVWTIYCNYPLVNYESQDARRCIKTDASSSSTILSVGCCKFGELWTESTLFSVEIFVYQLQNTYPMPSSVSAYNYWFHANIANAFSSLTTKNIIYLNATIIENMALISVEMDFIV